MQKLTVNELMQLVRECAGEGDTAPDEAADTGDLEFEVLGYDSLVLLETVSRLERDYGVRLDDDATQARTPRDLLELVVRSAADLA